MRKLLLFLLLTAPALAQNHAHMLSGINAQTGTSYTMLNTDVTKLVTFNNAATVTVTLPPATTTGFGAGTIFTVKNVGIGNVMIVSTSTIDGASSVLLTTGGGLDIYSDGANFNTGAGGNGSGGGGSGGSACSVNVLCKGTGSGLPVVDSVITDDSINPVRSSHGYNTSAGGISYEIANGNPGTTLNKLVCNNGSGIATICADNATDGILGFAQTGAGTTGNVQVCTLISCAAIFDNQSVPRDYAIAAVGGQLHDTGSQSPTGNNTNFLVQTANTGAGTVAQVRPPGDLSGAVGTPVGFANPMTTLGDIIVGGVAGAATRLPGATTLNGVPQVPVSIATGGVATQYTLAPSGIVPRFVTAATDTILFTDRGKFVQYTRATAIAVTVPQAGTTGFANNFYFCAENRGVGDVTFTPTTSTVNLAATYTLAQYSSGCFVSDNANYVTKDQWPAGTVLRYVPDGGLLSSFFSGNFLTNITNSAFTTTSGPLRLLLQSGATPVGTYVDLGIDNDFPGAAVVSAQNTDKTNLTGTLGANGFGLNNTAGVFDAGRRTGNNNYAVGVFGRAGSGGTGSSAQGMVGVVTDVMDVAAVSGVTNTAVMARTEFTGSVAVPVSTAFFGTDSTTKNSASITSTKYYGLLFDNLGGGSFPTHSTSEQAVIKIPAQTLTNAAGSNYAIKVDTSAGTSQFDSPLKVSTLNATNLLLSATAPTISSGFGTSPSVSANNGTAAFRINVGTGGSATAGIVGLPTATTGWNCSVNDITAAAAHVAYNTVQTASSTTTATLENQTKSTGAAVAWAASDILAVSCFAY